MPEFYVFATHTEGWADPNIVLRGVVETALADTPPQVIVDEAIELFNLHDKRFFAVVPQDSITWVEREP